MKLDNFEREKEQLTCAIVVDAEMYLINTLVILQRGDIFVDQS